MAFDKNCGIKRGTFERMISRGMRSGVLRANDMDRLQCEKLRIVIVYGRSVYSMRK